MERLEDVVTLEERRMGRVQRPLRPPWTLVLLGGTVAILMLLPLGYLVIRASGMGGEDIWRLLARRSTWSVLINSALLGLITTAASVSIGVPIAWLTARTDLPMRRFWAVATALPLVIPSYVGAYALVSVMGPRGLLQNLLKSFGVERLPEIYGLGGAALTIALINYPLVVLNVRAALARLDPSFEEVARSLGDSPLRAFFRVTLPHLHPSITSGGLLVLIYALSDFGTPSIMQFNTFTRAIYVQYRSSFNRSSAALLSLILVILTLLILTGEVLSRGRGLFHRVTPGAERPPAVFALGRSRLPALIFCSALVLLALALPISAICYWLVLGLINGGSLNLKFQEVANSLMAASLAAMASVVAALPITLLSVRYPGLLSRLLDRTAYIGGALPGIVIALSLVFFGANYAPFVYQTLFMLVFAYMVRFLPQAAGGIRSSLLQVSPRLEEAAQSLGRSRRSVLFTITLPLLMPGILWGGAMVFLTAIKELPLTLMLGPTGFDTLSTSIWHATSEGLFSQAAPPALLLVLVSGLSMILVLRGERGRKNG